MRHFKVMARERCRLVTTQEHASRCDVRRGRESFSARSAVDTAFQRHHIKKLVGRRSRVIAARLVHCGKDGANAFAGDGAGEKQVYPNAARSKLKR